MRKFLSILLVGLGAFLVVVGVVALTWVPGQIERTPLDTDSVTLLEGEATVLDESGPIKAFSENRIDSDASTDEVAVFNTSLCVVWDRGGIDGCVDEDDPDGRLISAEQSQFVADRHTGMAVDNGDLLPADAPQPEGLMNKWPFHTEQKTYPKWDGLVGAPIDTEFVEEDEIDGLDVYKFESDISVGPVEIVGDIEGTYNAVYSYWVEPTTGQIIKQQVSQERLAGGVETILTLDLVFTDEQIAANVADSKDSVATINLMTKTVPIIGFAVGIPLLIIGLVLMFLGRRRGEAPSASAAERKKPAGV